MARRPRKSRSLMPLRDSASDDIFALISAGNSRLNDEDLSRLCGITPQMIYQLREIAEGRPVENWKGIIEAFERLARYGHAPAKGAAKPLDEASQRQVVIVIHPPAAETKLIEAAVVKDAVVNDSVVKEDGNQTS